MVDLESTAEEKIKDLQFSDEFTKLVIDKTKRLFFEKRKVYEGRRSGLISKRTALESKRKVAENKYLDKLIEDVDFKRIHSELTQDLKQIDSELITLEDQKELDVDIAREVLLLTQNIHGAYKKASFDLKRQYLSLFWDKFDVKDGVILKPYPSPIFDELLRAEEAFFKKPKSENREFPSDSEEVIFRTAGLRGLDSNQGHPP